MRPKHAMPQGAAQSIGRQAGSSTQATAAAAAANNPCSMTRLTARSPTQASATGGLGSSGVGASAAANQHKQRTLTALKPALRRLRPAATAAAVGSIKRRVTFAPTVSRGTSGVVKSNGSSSGQVGGSTAGIALVTSPAGPCRLRLRLRLSQQQRLQGTCVTSTGLGHCQAGSS